jgi:hypothetical protein
VVVVVIPTPGRGFRNGLDDGNNRRLVVLAGLPSSVSTVTNSRCGDTLSPTSNSKVCFLGELAREANLVERWLRVTRREDGGMIEVIVSSLRGSGDDMMSTLGVAGFAMECQRTLND